MIKVCLSTSISSAAPSLHPSVIYRDVNNPTNRYYTFSDVRDAAIAFGEGLCDLWDWQKTDVLAIYAPNDIDFSPIVFGTFWAGGESRE